MDNFHCFNYAAGNPQPGADDSGPPSLPTRASKPPYSYVALIIKAIDGLGGKATLNQIYQYIETAFEYYRHSTLQKRKGWQNSIRHNLSLNRNCFMKLARDGVSAPDGRKGNYWSLRPGVTLVSLFDEGNCKRRKRLRQPCQRKKGKPCTAYREMPAVVNCGSEEPRTTEQLDSEQMRIMLNLSSSLQNKLYIHQLMQNFQIQNGGSGYELPPVLQGSSDTAQGWQDSVKMEPNLGDPCRYPLPDGEATTSQCFSGPATCGTGVSGLASQELPTSSRASAFQQGGDCANRGGSFFSSSSELQSPSWRGSFFTSPFSEHAPTAPVHSDSGVGSLSSFDAELDVVDDGFPHPTANNSCPSTSNLPSSSRPQPHSHANNPMATAVFNEFFAVKSETASPVSITQHSPGFTDRNHLGGLQSTSQFPSSTPPWWSGRNDAGVGMAGLWLPQNPAGQNPSAVSSSMGSPPPNNAHMMPIPSTTSEGQPVWGRHQANYDALVHGASTYTHDADYNFYAMMSNLAQYCHPDGQSFSSAN